MRRLLLLLVACVSFSATARDMDYRQGERLYVWAANGLNLRQSPAEQTAVVKLLPYGTAVEVAAQDAAPVAHQLVLYRAHGVTQTTAAQPELALNGHWLKVKAAGQEGYVFDGLLLDKTPKKKGEAPDAYLQRAFNLKVKPLLNVSSQKPQG